MKKEIKEKLYNHCLNAVKKQIEINDIALSNAQEAVNDETKNTAGDKYETGRAMKQLETEAIGRRISEAVEQHQLLLTIDINQPCDTVKLGALVYTSIGVFFIAISADEIVIDDEEYCVVSLQSPIGQQMLNCKAGSTFRFREKNVKILEIY